LNIFIARTDKNFAPREELARGGMMMAAGAVEVLRMAPARTILDETWQADAAPRASTQLGECESFT